MSIKTKQELIDYANLYRNTNGAQAMTGATENTMWNDVVDSMAMMTDVVDKPYINLTPQANAPTYVEGNLWYDNDKKTLAYQNEVEGIELNLGETWLRVINKTGSTIPNGSVVRNTGSDATTELPTIDLAIATSFETAFTIGITTHEIADGEIGYVTTMGEVGGLNTSAITAGSPVYLSDTVAGAFVNTPPSIASIMGLCLDSNATTGNIFVNVQNLLNFPGSIGIMQDLVTPAIPLVADIPVVLTNWATDNEITMIVDAAAGTIQVPNVAGFYRVGITCQLAFGTENQTRALAVELYNVTTATSIFTYVYNVPRDATNSSFSFQYPFADNQDSEYVVRVASENTETITFDKISFDIESSHLRQKQP